MHDDKQPYGALSQEAPWRQVSAIVGTEFLSKIGVDNRASLQALIENASAFGRDSHGPVREIQTLVGDRWSALLLMILNHGALRFSVLQRITVVVDRAGISRRMLSFTLRTLERNGLVIRHVLGTVPPNVEYSLTPLGHELSQRVMDFLAWLSSKSAEVEQARLSFEEKHGAKSLDPGHADPALDHDLGHDF